VTSLTVTIGRLSGNQGFGIAGIHGTDGQICAAMLACER
jgi:hypothetical protein